MTVRRTIGGLVATLLALGAAFGLVPAHAATWTSSSYASRLVALVNQARQQHGLPALTVASGTSQVAAAWTAHLDATQSLAHNPNLASQLETHGSPDWTTYGENVGQGPADNPDALFQAYMDSTEHRDNILNRAYRFTGVAVILDGKSAWNTFDFVDTYHSSTSTSATTQPKVKPRATATSRPAPAPAPARTTVAAAAPATKSLAAPHHHVTTKRARRPRPHTDGHVRAEAPLTLDRVSPATYTGGTSVLAASVRPLAPSLPASSRLTIAVAGLMLGFVAMRWWQVARAA